MRCPQSRRQPARPTMLALLILAVGAATRSAAGSAGSTTDRRQQPNVVLIYADDLGWGDLGCYGHTRFSTPNLDRMAAEGVRLTDFQSCCPYCAPSRAALQTGRYPFRYAFTSNPLPLADPAGREELDALGLPLQETTLGDLFRGAGYRTACIGKWHLGHRREFRPLRRGYQEYLGILYSNDMHRVELIDRDRVVEYPVIQATLTRRYTDRALDFLERNRRRPFFLFFPHAMPHKPLAASEAFYKKSGAGLYGDAVAELDWSVGRMLDKLRSLGLERDTLVLFASDNGPWYGGSTGGLRGMKSQTWEGGIRVPLLARWPGKIPAGQVRRTPAIIMDLFATSLAAAGIPVPGAKVIDGRDLMPVFTGQARELHRVVCSVTTRGVCTIRSGRWKLHLQPPSPPSERTWKAGEHYTDPRAPDGVRILAPFEQAHPSEFPGVRSGDRVMDVGLFDLETDPSEQHNVAAGNPAVVAALRQAAVEIQRGPEPEVNIPGR